MAIPVGEGGALLSFEQEFDSEALDPQPPGSDSDEPQSILDPPAYDPLTLPPRYIPKERDLSSVQYWEEGALQCLVTWYHAWRGRQWGVLLAADVMAVVFESQAPHGGVRVLVLDRQCHSEGSVVTLGTVKKVELEDGRLFIEAEHRFGVPGGGFEKQIRCAVVSVEARGVMQTRCPQDTDERRRQRYERWLYE